MHIWKIVNLWNTVYTETWTLCNPGIWELQEYSEPYQISTMKRFVQNLV